MFFALRMVALAMIFGRSAVGFCCILVMFGCFVMFVSSHWFSPGYVRRQLVTTERGLRWFLLSVEH